MISRRRFITIAAAASVVPTSVFARNEWRGRAFGAEVSISLHGDRKSIQTATAAARDTILRLERMFSIYDPTSEVSQLNKHGRLVMAPEFARLMVAVDRIHRKTNGLFDPTVQPIFAKTLSAGRKLSLSEMEKLHTRVGWSKVDRTDTEVRFKNSAMAITLNGIAQGFATDRVTEVLQAHGFENALVNIGEYRAGDEPAKLSVSDMKNNTLAKVELQNGALATSSINGYVLPDGSGHILSPKGNAEFVWDTVSVEAENATDADGYSTALILSPDTKLAKQLVRKNIVKSVVLSSRDGNVIRI